MPPGVKFSPKEGELLGYYLYNHIRRTLPPAHYSAIRRHDLYGDDEPWEIWRRLQSSVEDPGDAYAFTELKKKLKSCGGKSKRSGRKVGRGGGNWHGEDVGTNFSLVRRARSPVEKEERWTGMRKRFIYQNPNPQFASEHKKWILYQFSLTREGCSEEEKEVVCMIRNNGSPIGNSIVEAARKSALAGRKRKLEDYIKKISSKGDVSTSSKRVCYPNPLPPQQQQLPLPPQQQQQLPLPPTVVDCFNPLPPLATNVLPQQPQPAEEGEEEDLETLDVISWIDFGDGEFDWGDQGGSGFDPQSVLEFPQGSSDHDDEHYHTTATKQEETNEPVYLLPPTFPIADYCSQPAPAAGIPVAGDDGQVKTGQEETNEPLYLPPHPGCFEPAAAAADPVVEEGDAGEGKMVAAAAAEDDAANDFAPQEDSGKGIMMGGEDDTSRHAADSAMVQPWDVTMGRVELSDHLLVDMPPFEQPPCLVNPSEGYASCEWEANEYVDLWGFGPMYV
ncbi:unnamed protein product [Linum trigynum]